MNDQLPTDQRQLEKATQRQPLSNGSGTTDLKMLAARQAWLAMGKAAEGAGRDGLNHDALLASLQNELLKKPPEQTPDVRRQVDWSWAAVAIAATVLIAATIVGALSQRQEVIPGPVTPSQIAQPTPKTQPAPSVPDSIPEIPENVTPRENSIAESSSSWTDLDEAIQSTYTVLQQMGQQRSSVDQSLTDFDTQLKQLSADIAGESL